MTKFELRAQIALKKNDAFKVLEVIDNEQRALTAEEEAKYNELLEQIKELEAKMNEVEENDEDKEEEVETPTEETPTEETPTEEPTQETEETPTEETPTEETPSEEEDEEKNKENRNLNSTMKNFVQEIRSAVESRQNQRINLFEKRDAITVSADGPKTVFEDLLGVEGRLKSNPVLGKMKHFSSINNGAFVTYSGANAEWVTEGQKLDSNKGTFNKVTFKPLELKAVVEISDKALVNMDPSFETTIKNDILDAIEEKLLATILGTGDGKKGGDGEDKDDVIAPKGLLCGKETKNVLTYAEICTLEEELETANYNNYSYIISPKAKSLLRQTSVSGGKSDIRMLFEDNAVLGTDAASTSTCAGIALADWSKVAICTWKNASVLVDVYTKADEGIVRLIATLFVDAQALRTDAVKGYIVG